MLNSHIHLDFDNVNSPSSSTTGVIVPSTGKDNWDNVIACSQKTTIAITLLEFILGL